MAEVSDRADRAVSLALENMASRDVLFVGHGHFSRSVITRWVELPLVEGSRFWKIAGVNGRASDSSQACDSSPRSD